MPADRRALPPVADSDLLELGAGSVEVGSIAVVIEEYFKPSGGPSQVRDDDAEIGYSSYRPCKSDDLSRTRGSFRENVSKWVRNVGS